MSRSLIGCFDPQLMEEAVFHFQRAGFVATECDEQRRRLYEVSDAEERERLFQDLYRCWFGRYGLGKPIDDALGEQAIIAARVDSCYVLCATQAKEEGAELFVASHRSSGEDGQRRTLRILIRPESLLKPESAITFLRHELFHIADMLDPAFAYMPALPKTDGGAVFDTLITNRYRVLWDVTINGRMMRRGWLPDSTREREFGAFCRGFAMLAQDGEEQFQRFFDAVQPKHWELAAFAFDPRAAARLPSARVAAATHCPLCKFPTQVFEPNPETLGDDILAAIGRDFPNWKPIMGLCAQCADLYRANRLSMSAALALPGGL
jgi:hypothetical protein